MLSAECKCGGQLLPTCEVEPFIWLNERHQRSPSAICDGSVDFLRRVAGCKQPVPVQRDPAACISFPVLGQPFKFQTSALATIASGPLRARDTTQHSHRLGVVLDDYLIASTHLLQERFEIARRLSIRHMDYAVPHGCDYTLPPGQNLREAVHVAVIRAFFTRGRNNGLQIFS